jgi:hypothetical protein
MNGAILADTGCGSLIHRTMKTILLMHIRSAIRRVAPLIPLLILVGACRDKGPATALRLHLRAGSTYRVWTTTEQSVIGAGGMKQSIGLGITYSVEGVGSAGVATLRVSYDSATFTGEGPAGKQSITSADIAADTSIDIPPGAAGYMALVGQGFVMRVAPDGHVRGVEGGDSLRRAVAERLSGSNKFLTGVAENYLDAVFSDSALVRSIEQSLAIYPPEPVVVGSSWETTSAMPGGFPLTLHSEYELESRAGGIATIDVTSKIESNRAPSGGTPSIMGFEYDLAGKQKGKITIREEDGWPVGSELTQEFSGTLRQGNSVDSAKKIEYPVSVRGSVTTRLLEH